jgi:hypothetical protein
MDATDTTVATGASAPAQRARLRHHPLFGGLLIKEGLINQAQLDRVLALQQETEPRPLLGQLLLDQKLITPHELNAVLSKYHRQHLLGDVLLETRAITPAQLETALAMQRKTDCALGDALIQLGFITERQLNHALAIQLRIPFVDLDDRPIDPGMRATLSESYARHHRVLPLAQVEGRLVLAMVDPTDLDVVAEVRSCTGRPVDVVTATTDAMERAFEQLYRDPGDARASGRLVTFEETSGPTAAGPATPEAAAPRQAPRLPSGGDALPRRAGEQTRRSIDAVESLFAERREERAEIERLSGQLRESRAALEHAHRELEARARALTTLEAAHATALQERDALGRALADLRERHDALLREREFTIDRVTEALRRLRS